MFSLARVFFNLVVINVSYCAEQDCLREVQLRVAGCDSRRLLESTSRWSAIDERLARTQGKFACLLVSYTTLAVIAQPKDFNAIKARQLTRRSQVVVLAPLLVRRWRYTPRVGKPKPSVKPKSPCEATGFPSRKTPQPWPTTSPCGPVG